MNSNLIQEIFKSLYKKYRINYSKKEIKLALIITVFIYYIVEHKEEYNLQLNSMLEKEVIASLVKIGREGFIESEIIVPLERKLNLNTYISNVYRNLKVRKDIKFMQNLCEHVSKCEGISVTQLVEFINLELEKDEVKEAKTINKLIKKIAPKYPQKVLDNFSGIGESIFSVVENNLTNIRLQDIDEIQCAIATILLVMYQYQNFKVINTNTLTYFDDEKFDLIISIPPLIMDTTQIMESRNDYSINTLNKRDSWGGLKISFDKLDIKGQLITLVNTGALTSSKRADECIREYLIRRGYIKAIIEFPEKMLHGTNVKTSLLIIEKYQRPEIILINLDSKEGEKYLQKNQTSLVQITEEGIDEIYNILYKNKSSEIAIKVNEENLIKKTMLLPSLYIIKEDKYEHKDLIKLLEERSILKRKIKDLEEQYRDILERKI